MPLARMGSRITAIELGATLAAEARRHLADFPGSTVITSSFEAWLGSRRGRTGDSPATGPPS